MITFRDSVRWRVVGIGLVLGVLAILAGEAGTLLVVSRPIAHPDAIVSLASHEWERLPATARQAADNPSALVLLTLPEPATPDNCHDCAGRTGRLQRLGVSPDRVHIVPLVARGTYGEAMAVFGFARHNHLARLLIVTTPYHTRRALATFNAVFGDSGIEIGIEPAGATSPARPERWWAAPYDRAYVAYEWAARAYYAVRYGVAVWP